MNSKAKIFIKLSLVILTFGLSLTSLAVWTAPDCAPPDCNTPAPLNVGSAPQDKGGLLILYGGLGVQNSLATFSGLVEMSNKLGIGVINPTHKLHIVGTGPSVKIVDGAQGLNKIFASDIDGLATWKTAAELGLGGNPMTALGDMIYGGATPPGVPTRLPIGTNGQVLTVGSSGIPAWQTASGGGDGWWVRDAGLTRVNLLNINDNIGIGSSTVIYKNNARFLHTTGANLFLGQNAGNLTLSGIANTGVGELSLDALTSGNSNTGFGSFSLGALQAGSNNAGLGNGGLAQLTSGNRNVSIGIEAGDEINSGDDNIFIGYDSGKGLGGTGSKNIIIGRSICAAGGSESYSDNVFVGYNAGCDNDTGGNNVAVGMNALDNPTTGANNTAIGAHADVSAVNLNNTTALGYQALVNASNKVRIGNGSVTVYETQVAWTVGSDARFKNNIKDLDLGLDFIKNLRPVSYQMKNDTDDRASFGFIAQEVEKVLGDRKTKLVDTQVDGEQMKYMRYDDLIAPMVKAIQEQQAKIESLEDTNESLEKRILILESKFNDLLTD